MTRRAPLHVVVFPFRLGPGGYEYAVFCRSDGHWWQGIAGGADEGESAGEAAVRESEEEAGVPSTAHFYPLSTVDSVPVTHIHESKRSHWPGDVFVVPNQAFAVDCSNCELRLSAEHTAFEWLPFDAATERLLLENNRVALWELHQRLLSGRLPAPLRTR